MKQDALQITWMAETEAGIGVDVRIIFTAKVKCIPGNLNTSFFLFFIASFLYELYEYKNI
jgi:hypothetical protein